MGRRTAVAFAAVLILGPLLSVAGYRHWLNTRTFHPLDIPVSLSVGHIRTPGFYINLPGPYYVDIDVDYAATYTGGCPQQAWQSLRTHTAAYENGVRLGEVENSHWIGVLSVDTKGYYSLDIEVLTDAACLNSARPRLRVSNVSDFPYEDVYQFGTWLVLVSTVVGLGLLACSVSGYAQRRRETLVVAELDGTTTSTGLPPRRLERRKLISALPPFPLICATLMALIIFIEAIFHTPVPSKGLWVSIREPRAVAQDSDAELPPIVVVLRSGSPGSVPTIRVNSKTVQWSDLNEELKQQLRLRPRWVVYIDGDSNMRWQNIVEVADIARDLHAKVVLLTPRTREFVAPSRHSPKLVRK